MQPVALLSIVSLLFVVAARSENLVKNPGFEDEGGWSHHVWKGQYENTITNNLFHAGSKAAVIKNTGETGNSAFYPLEPIQVQENITYRLSVCVKAEGATESGLSLNIPSQSGGPVTFRFCEGTYDWKMHGYEFEVPKGKTEIRIYLYNKGRGTVWFDDVSLEALKVLK